ncbi:MAG: thioredoxin fold domain-containing protein [Flavobacterium sp.]|nr:thioredoxin fold domain-containing protein [Flavobacterium sp.]
MNSKIISLSLICLLFLSCQGQQTKTVQTVDVTAFAEKLKATDKAQLLDVRTPEEFKSGHIENATNVNWNSNDFVSKAENYDKSKPVFVYCKIGGRSVQAANRLAELGFKEIYNLDGGIMKWNATENTKPSDKIIGICDQEYAELIKSSDKVMIDFNAKWCAPCKKMNPYILKFQTEMADKIKIVQLDADENKTIVDQLKLDGLPVIIVYEKGKEVWRNVGYISEEELRKHL